MLFDERKASCAQTGGKEAPSAPPSPCPYQPEHTMMMSRKLFAALERKLLEHRFPHFLILKAFTRIGYAGIDGIKDTGEQTLEHFRSLVIKIFGFLDIATEHFIA